jgi:DNA-binding transcriptional LysR family regulator
LVVIMHLARWNMNLFVAFDALVKANTLTEAAETLYITQSALSVALRQMREYFDDELFIYRPKRKEMTPLARSLHPLVLETLAAAKSTLLMRDAVLDEPVALNLGRDGSLFDQSCAASNA